MVIIDNNPVNLPLTPELAETLCPLRFDPLETSLLERIVRCNVKGLDDKREEIREGLKEICNELNLETELSHDQKIAQLKIRVAYAKIQSTGVHQDKIASVLVALEAAHELDRRISQELLEPNLTLKSCSQEKAAAYQKQFGKVVGKMIAIKREELTKLKDRTINLFFNKIVRIAIHDPESLDTIEIKVQKKIQKILEKESIYYTSNYSEEDRLDTQYDILNRLTSIDEKAQFIEFYQDEDPQASLQDGVCWALSINFAAQLAHNPHIRLEDFAPTQIHPRERVSQALLKLDAIQRARHPDDTGRIFPVGYKRVLDRYNMEEGNLKADIRATDSRKLVGKLMDEINKKWEKFQQGSPSIILGMLGENDNGHAIYLRFDEKRQRYIFFDPNYYSAELSGVSRQEGMNWLQNLLTQTMARAYTDLSKRAVFANIKPAMASGNSWQQYHKPLSTN